MNEVQRYEKASNAATTDRSSLIEERESLMRLRSEIGVEYYLGEGHTQNEIVELNAKIDRLTGLIAVASAAETRLVMMAANVKRYT